MATIGGVAALLQIGVRADTRQATTALRAMDTAVKKSATTAKSSTSTLTASYQKQVKALGSANASYQQAARHMGVTAAEARKLAQANQRLATSTDKADKEQKEFNQTAGPLTSKLKGIGKAAAGAAAAYVGLGAAKDAITTTEELAKATISLNKNLNISAKTAGGLAAELRVRGVDTNKVTMITKSYSNAIIGAKDAQSSQAQSFKALGVSTKELKKLNPDQLLFAIADGATEVGKGAERTKALGQLFGRGFGPLRPLFTGGAEGLRELIKANTDAGANLGAKGGGIDAIKGMIDEQRQVKRESQGLSVAFTQNLAPALIFVMQQIGKYINFATRMVNEGFKPIGLWIAKIARQWWDMWGPAIKRIIEISKQIGKWFIQAFKDVKQAGTDAVQWLKNAAGNIKDAFQGVIQWFKTAWADLGDIIAKPFQVGIAKIRGFLSAIIDAINSVPILPDINNPFTGGGGGGGGSATPPHSKQANQKQRGGMMVGGSGTGDKISALLEPGEFVLNRNAVSAIGASQLKKLNKDIPRFISGGAVLDKATGAASGAAGAAAGAAGKLAGKLVPNLPGIGSLPGWLQGIGKWALGGAVKWIAGKSAAAATPTAGAGTRTMDGKPVAQWIYDIVSVARRKGVDFGITSGYRSTAEQAAIYNSGVRPAAPPGSSHHEGTKYPSGAIDVSPGALSLAGWLGAGGKRVNQGRFVYAGAQDPVHFSHPFGGGYQGGGPVPKHGSKWLKLGHYNMNQAATLLWQAGLSPSQASDLSRVIEQESGGDPHAGPSSAGAKGLFQILTRTAPGNLYNPVINALNAAALYKDRGMQPWNASRAGWSASGGHILPALVGGNGGNGGAAGGGGGTPAEKFQTAFPGISLKLLKKLHRSLFAPAREKLQANTQAAKAALASARGPAAKIAAMQGLNAAKGAKKSYFTALRAYLQASKTGKGERKALEALITMEQALTAAPEASEVDTSALDTENERIRAMNELISQGNLLALQGFQVSASQNPLLGMSSDRFPTQTSLSPLLTSLPSAASAPAAGGGGTPKVNVHIHHKKGHPNLGDLIDVRIQGQMKKTARKGNRRLPSGRGA